MIDLLVAGGGPTGLATAIAAARHGWSVTVVEPRTGPVDKACGEGLMPAALHALRDLGVVVPPGRPFVGIRYVRDGRSAEGHFPGEPGRGIRRTALHRALRERADALGVRHVSGRVRQFALHGDHVTADGTDARWVAVADGLRSRLRVQLGLDRPARWPARYGLRRHFAVAPWSDHVEVHWADDAEAYVTPVGPELVGVAFLFGDAARQADRGQPGRPFDRLLARFPDLAARLHDPVTAARGAGPFAARSARRTEGRAFLVGDAAGYLDPLTGEGIKLGVTQAVAAVEAMRAGDPAAYERAWRREYRTYAALTGGLLLATRTRLARRALVPVARHVPGVFSTVLATLGAPGSGVPAVALSG